MPGNSRKVKVAVEIDGEKKYKETLAELNEGNKVLASEVRKLKAEYQGSAESIEFLTKKGDILDRQLLQQQDKVAQLKEALSHSAEAYGEADKRTQEWAVKLNDAEAAQYRLEHAIAENNEAIQGQGKEMTGLGDTVDQLADKFGINLPDSAKEALNGMQSFSAETVAAMAAAAAAVVAVIEVTKKLGKMTLEVAAQVDELVTESSITGVSTEMLQAWDYAANLIDVDADTIKAAMTKITSAMGDAYNGSDAAIEKFEKLGVSISNADGSLRSSEEVFYDAIDALGKVRNETERNTLAMDLMGKGVLELNPLIKAGSGAFREYAEEAENVGYILDEEQIKKLSEADDSYQRLQLTIEANRKQMASDFAPAVKAAMELFTDVVDKAGKMLKDSHIIENLSIIIENLIEIIRSGGEILSGIPGFNQGLELVKNTLGAIAQFTAVVADAGDLLAAILSPSTWGSGQIKNALGLGYGSGNANRYQRVVMQQQGRLEQYDDYYSAKYGRNAGGTDYWRGGLTWVGEAGPELISLPQGTKILNSEESRHAAGTQIFYVTIDAKNVKEFNDIIKMAFDAEAESRMR